MSLTGCWFKRAWRRAGSLIFVVTSELAVVTEAESAKALDQAFAIPAISCRRLHPYQ